MKKSPIQNGIWTCQANDKYHVTGKDKYGRYFKRVCDNWHMARSINVWKGSRWLVRDGQRYLIERVYN